MRALLALGRPALEALSEALASGRLVPPIHSSQLDRYTPRHLAVEIAARLNELQADGMKPAHMAKMLALCAEERAATQALSDRTELVWSGTDVPGAMSRDTRVVVKSLFREAKRKVLISSYAIDRGRWVKDLFGDLASRMDDEPALTVHLYLNVTRRRRDEREDSVLLREFAETFRHDIWPGERLPDVFHDPRSLKIGGATRACLHAKCIVIDESKALVTSANVTEAAQERNIEAGVLLSSAQLARSLWLQFEALVERGALRRVPGV
jgi:hypothetical protein